MANKLIKPTNNFEFELKNLVEPKYAAKLKLGLKANLFKNPFLTVDFFGPKIRKATATVNFQNQKSENPPRRWISLRQRCFGIT